MAPLRKTIYVLILILIPLILNIANGTINTNNGDKSDNAGLARLKNPKHCKNTD